MDVLTLLDEARRTGLDVTVDGHRLVVRGPRRAEHLAKQILARKEEVLVVLQEEERIPEYGDGDRPSVDRCPLCREPDFTRPLPRGMWCCARCHPYMGYAPSDLEWWPKIGLRVPIDEDLGTAATNNATNTSAGTARAVTPQRNGDDMAKLNWSNVNKDTTFRPVDPGTYYAEVERCEENKSANSGDPYFNIRFKEVPSGRFLCYDNIMLEGRGKDIGYAKLTQLGIDETVGELAPLNLIGRRVYLALKHHKKGDEVRAAVNINKFRCGYMSEKDGAPPRAAGPKEDVPF